MLLFCFVVGSVPTKSCGLRSAQLPCPGQKGKCSHRNLIISSQFGYWWLESQGGNHKGSKRNIYLYGILTPSFLKGQAMQVCVGSLHRWTYQGNLRPFSYLYVLHWTTVWVNFFNIQNNARMIQKSSPASTPFAVIPVFTVDTWISESRG